MSKNGSFAQVRVMLVAHQKVEPFIKMTASPILDYRRTAAVSFASFTLHETNKPLLVQAGAVMAMLALVVDDDLAIKRDAAFALSNISDSPELQGGMIGHINILVSYMLIGLNSVRSCARRNIEDNC